MPKLLWLPLWLSLVGVAWGQYVPTVPANSGAATPTSSAIIVGSRTDNFNCGSGCNISPSQNTTSGDVVALMCAITPATASGFACSDNTGSNTWVYPRTDSGISVSMSGSTGTFTGVTFSSLYANGLNILTSGMTPSSFNGVTFTITGGGGTSTLTATCSSGCPSGSTTGAGIVLLNPQLENATLATTNSMGEGICYSVTASGITTSQHVTYTPQSSGHEDCRLIDITHMTGSPFDKCVQGQSAGSNPTTSGTFTPGSSAAEIVLGGGIWNNNTDAFVSYNASFTGLDNNTNASGYGFYWEYTRSTAVTGLTANVTITTSNANAALTCGFLGN